MSRYNKRKAKGVILPIVGLILAVLLGMAGLVIDLGGLFVARTELQSAVDSCALAAAQELDGVSDSTVRAANAGLTAGNANQVQFQKVAVAIAASDITFSDALNGSFSSTFSATGAKYAKCTRAVNGIAAYFIQMVGGPSSNGVAAVAVATRTHAQRSCAIPLGLIQKNTTPPDYGFTVGEWVKMRYDNSVAGSGEMGWFNLDKSTNANETAAEMLHGYCGASLGDTLFTPGNQATVTDVWNSRFGIYKSNGDMTVMTPDYSGYAYTPTNWPAQASAYDGAKPTTCSPACPTAANFLTKRASYANYADTGTQVSVGEAITNQNLTGGFNVLAKAGQGQDLATLGSSRRMVNVPVLSAGGVVTDYACMLMLHPVATNTKDAYLEYRGNAGAANSPCLGTGLAGGTAGPLVPVLVE
ncbi:hypothetical protein LMG31506_02208 [Cupriavidus yeoncheonensis]|uniref:Putative Flp pilus-assembly TadG-like N-terminal domain-containing protein n=1 Tax=Cupriavidus yeoncheonensis TaxID=1462994 RepID=A0A916N3B8_9BURK|nr:pilus assembly protein TadG-related protein [Cupriavidus yeoncheonensis]CAG2140168.1 hypothetical protein LMG31506_02208 [Cupriavidus yeoncheonensis]